MMKMNQREQALYNVQVAGFAVYDANLFLDTHPHDADALAAMTEYRHKYDEDLNHLHFHHAPPTEVSVERKPFLTLTPQLSETV